MFNTHERLCPREDKSHLFAVYLSMCMPLKKPLEFRLSPRNLYPRNLTILFGDRTNSIGQSPHHPMKPPISDETAQLRGQPYSDHEALKKIDTTSNSVVFELVSVRSGGHHEDPESCHPFPGRPNQFAMSIQ